MVRGIGLWLNKDARLIIEIGNATIRLEGRIKNVSKDWITIKTEEGYKTLRKEHVILIEERR